MSLNPDQLFTITSVSRQDIAQVMRDSLDWIEYTHPSGDNTILDDDDRLTNEVCKDYATMLGEIDYVGDSSEFTSSREHEAIRYVLSRLGFINKEQAEILQDKIEQLHRDIEEHEKSINQMRVQIDLLMSQQTCQ